MSLPNRHFSIVSKLLSACIAVTIMGCAIGVPSKPSSNIERSQDVLIEDNAVVTIAPRELLEEVSQEIVTDYENIEIVDGLLFRDTAFPQGGWRLKKLLIPEICRRVSEQLNVDYLVLIGALENIEGKERGFFLPLLVGAMSAEGTTSITALIVDLRKGEIITKITSRASGTGHFLYYVIIMAGNVPLTDSEAISGLAKKIGGVITELTPQGNARLAVLGLDLFEVGYDVDDWKSDHLNYKNELALEIVKERAKKGEKDAQWFLYQVQPDEETMIWLCREADQGDMKARSELGMLYYYGSDKYGKSTTVHVPSDLPKSCMWFHLAGQAEITEKPQTKETQVKPKSSKTAEVERTAKVMSAQEIEEAETMFQAWEPGNCEREISQHMVSEYVKDPALNRLCTAADLGDYSSRDELGRIYFLGSRGVKRDLKQAYMWYLLADKVYQPPSMYGNIMQNYCDAMAPEQRSIAVKLLEEWEPGKCEEDLFRYRQ